MKTLEFLLATVAILGGGILCGSIILASVMRCRCGKWHDSKAEEAECCKNHKH